MQVNAIRSVAQGGSSIPGKVAGLGRAAMFANFINMMDDWLKIMKQYEQQGATKNTYLEGLPSSPFATYQKCKNGQFAVPNKAQADIAATLLLAIA